MIEKFFKKWTIYQDESLQSSSMLVRAAPVGEMKYYKYRLLRVWVEGGRSKGHWNLSANSSFYFHLHNEWSRLTGMLPHKNSDSYFREFGLGETVNTLESCQHINIITIKRRWGGSTLSHINTETEHRTYQMEVFIQKNVKEQK